MAAIRWSGRHRLMPLRILRRAREPARRCGRPPSRAPQIAATRLQGRPDLAGESWGPRAPTLLIVGSRDDVVIDLNRKAQRLMTEAQQLVLVEGATHLFEEPGTLAEAASHARNWFVRHLPSLSGIRRQWS